MKGKGQGSPTKTPQKAKRSNGDVEKIEAENAPTPELSEDQMHALVAQWAGRYDNAEALKKEAAQKLKDICTQAKAEIGDDAVAMIKDYLALRTPEGEEKMESEVARKVRVARWVSAALGTQFQMFEDMRPATERAFDEGKAACFRGDPRKPPHDPSVPQHQTWLKGYEAGQEVLCSKFHKPTPEKIGTEEPTLKH